MKPRDTMLPKIKDAKKAGMTRKETQELIEASTRKAAADQQWRDSELAMTLGHYRQLLDKVYGKETPS